MKTRMTKQEMVYEFMIALASNSSTHRDWLEWDMEVPLADSYGDHVHALASEMADNYLKNL